MHTKIIYEILAMRYSDISSTVIHFSVHFLYVCAYVTINFLNYQQKSGVLLYSF